jgi:hypothetical protein
VSRETLKNNKSFGGLYLSSVSDIIAAQRIKMIYKIIHSEVQNWNAIGKHFLKWLDSEYEQDYILCSFSCFEKYKLPKTFSPFYENALKYWDTFLKSFNPSTPSDILNLNLFGNHLFKTNRRPLLIKQFLSKNIKQLKDIWDLEQNNFVSENEIVHKVSYFPNFSSLWKKIKLSIPDALIRNLRDVTHSKVTKPPMSRSHLNLYDANNTFIYPHKLKSKHILAQLQQKKNNINLKVETKWVNKVALNSNLNWRKIWLNPSLSFSSIQAKEFQWKFLHNAINTEHRLGLMGLSNGLCNLCHVARETLHHLFIECIHVKPFLNDAEKIIKDLTLHQGGSTLSETVILFGSQDGQLKNEINTVIFEIKFHIWKYRNEIKFSQCYQSLYKYRNLMQCRIKELLSYKKTQARAF